jgi:hypothetical protein
MTNDDEIQIIVNIDTNSLSTSAYLFSDETVAASGSKKSTTSIPTGQLSKCHVYVTNKGASANCTVNIYTSPTSSTTGSKKNLATFTLGAGTTEVPYNTGNGIDPQQLDNYGWAEIVNGGTADAIITVEFSMFR